MVSCALGCGQLVWSCYLGGLWLISVVCGVGGAFWLSVLG